jgi:hypothetical protein
MTREEEIREKAKSLYYHFCVRETCEGEDDCTNCPYGKVKEPLVTMAEWADSHPQKGLWDSEKVCSFIEENIDNYLYINRDWNAPQIKSNFIEDLKKAMEK